MNRTFAGLLVAVAVLVVSQSRASAQVVIQGEGQAGGVYGSGSVYVQGGQGQVVQAQPQPYAQPSAYLATSQPVQQQPVRTIIHTSPTMQLLVPGIIAFGAGWLLSGISATAISNDCTSFGTFSGCPSGEWVGFSWIPLVGPWIAYGLSDSGSGEYSSGGYEYLNVVFGIVQGAGLILFILGLSIQQEWEEAIYADLGEGRTLTFSGGATGSGAQLGAELTF